MPFMKPAGALSSSVSWRTCMGIWHHLPVTHTRHAHWRMIPMPAALRDNQDTDNSGLGFILPPHTSQVSTPLPPCPPQVCGPGCYQVYQACGGGAFCTDNRRWVYSGLYAAGCDVMMLLLLPDWRECSLSWQQPQPAMSHTMLFRCPSNCHGCCTLSTYILHNSCMHI